jgi:hypothetical protein
MKKLIIIAGALALSGCGGGEEQGNGAAGGGAKSAAAGGGSLELTPGQYEVTTQVLSFDVPNMPPEMAEMMKQQQQQNEKSTTCLTEKDVRDAQGGLFTGEEDKECSENSVKLSGGRMAGRLVCGKGEEASTMEVAGTYTSTSYDVQMTMSAKGTKMSSRTTGRRVGDCPAGEAQEG